MKIDITSSDEDTVMGWFVVQLFRPGNNLYFVCGLEKSNEIKSNHSTE